MTTYEKNLNLFLKAVKLEKVERIPFLPCAPAFFPLDGGISLKTAINDFATSSDVNLKQHIKYKATGTQANIFSPYLLSGYWLSKISVPGDGVGDYELWQMNEEKDFVTQEDYHEILRIGFGEWYTKFKKERLGDLDAKLLPYFQYAPASGEQFFQAGLPIVMSMLMITPFEYLCGGRSMESFFMDDLFDEPELTKEVFDNIMDYSMNTYAAMADMLHPVGAWIGGWRSAPEMISIDMLKEWVLPYMKKYVNLCIEKNIVPILHLDSNWDKALECFQDFPAKKCVMALDGKTDIYKAKSILGDRMCIMGDVPPEMLAFGDYDEVYRYCEKLIHEIGPTGFILASGCDVPPNAKSECVMAMGDAAEQVRP